MNLDNLQDNIGARQTDEAQNIGITVEDQETAKFCIEYALSQGASAARVAFGKNTLDSISFLNGEVDKVSHCADRSIFISIFANGRYGGYSTNRLDEESLKSFISNAIDRTLMLAEDPFRCLPDPARYAKNAVTGEELQLTDSSYPTLNASDRFGIASKGVKFNALNEDLSKGSLSLAPIISKNTPDSSPSDPIHKDISNDAVENISKDASEATNKGKLKQKGTKFKIISEECEYSDSTDDSYIVDSQGFEGRHRETSFNFWTEITIEDSRHRKYTGYHWDSSPFLRGIKISDCSPIALSRAANAINPKAIKSGKYTMVVENTSASRLVAPILNALNAMSIQQNNSFLADSLGKKLFPEELTIFDFATTPSRSGSRLFDSEGIATADRSIISNGVVSLYFVNTYMSKKMSIAPTIEGSSRPTILPFLRRKSPANELQVSSTHHENNSTKKDLRSEDERTVIFQNVGCQDSYRKNEEIQVVENKMLENVDVESCGGKNDVIFRENKDNQVVESQELGNVGIENCEERNGNEEIGDKEIDLQRIIEYCGDGILVTGFNGGNCNPTTGNFSYGVEGFLFKDGKILHPVKETLITGDMLTLWNSLIAAGSDAKPGTRWQIPTLAFSATDFSA